MKDNKMTIKCTTETRLCAQTTITVAVQIVCILHLHHNRRPSPFQISFCILQMSQEASSSSIPRYPHGWYALHADLAARPEFASLSQAAFIHLVNSEWQNAPPELRNHYSLKSLSRFGEGDEPEQQLDESNTSTAVQYPPPSQMDFVNGPFDPLGPSPPIDAYSPTESSPASSIQLDPSSRDHGPVSPPSSDVEDGELKVS